ncbi:MAG: hypothetical protein NVSMB9_19960 [Isosphaeraceae bacterium]
MPASSVRELSRQWTERLASYRLHRNDEHLEALVEEAVRYTGMHLENDLSSSPYWSRAPLARRVAVLLFLVDHGVVERRLLKGKRIYEAQDHAETWVIQNPDLAPYAGPTLELVAALRHDLKRRTPPTAPDLHH